MVGGQNHGKKTVTSLYFGGGTPALAAGRLKEIIDAVRTHFTITEGIGAELHPDNLTIPLLQTLKAAGISKISIGIQSFQPRLQKLLGRSPLDTDGIQAALKAIPFETVSMDFILPCRDRPSQTSKRILIPLLPAVQIILQFIRLLILLLRQIKLRPCPKRKNGSCLTLSRNTACALAAAEALFGPFARGMMQTIPL